MSDMQPDVQVGRHTYIHPGRQTYIAYIDVNKSIYMHKCIQSNRYACKHTACKYACKQTQVDRQEAGSLDQGFTSVTVWVKSNLTKKGGESMGNLIENINN